MKIAAFAASNFKGFPNQTLKIDIVEKLNILVGQNNSGKTTVLEAVNYIFNGIKSSIKYNEAYYKYDINKPTTLELKIRMDSDEVDGFIISDLPGFQDAKEILQQTDVLCTYTLTEKAGMTLTINSGEIAEKYKSVASRKDYFSEKMGTAKAAQFERVVPQFTDKIKSLLQKTKVIYINPTRSLKVESNYFNIADFVNNGDGSGISGFVSESLVNSDLLKDKKIIREIVNEVSEFIGIGKLDTLSPIRFSNLSTFALGENKKQELPITFYGQGTLNIFTIFFYLRYYIESGENVIILLDEPENSLHPALQKKFLRFLENKVTQNKNIQIFIATQSPFFIDYADINTQLYRISVNVIPQIKPIEYKNRFVLFDDIGVNASLFLQSKAVLLVEGVEELLCLPILLKKIGYDLENNNVVIINMGGDNMAHCDLKDIQRLNANVIAWIDGEKNSPKEHIKQNRIDFKKQCDDNNIPCMLLDKQRSTVNIIPKPAIERYYKIPIGELQFNAYDKLNESLLAKDRQYSKPMEIVKIADVVTADEAMKIDELQWLKNELEKF